MVDEAQDGEDDDDSEANDCRTETRMEATKRIRMEFGTIVFRILLIVVLLVLSFLMLSFVVVIIQYGNDEVPLMMV